MKHLDEGELQALLDGELAAADALAAEAHLAGCPACARAAAELRRDHELLSRGLALADVPAPVAAAQMSVRGRHARAQRWAGETRRALARAAALVVLAAGAASAAVPGVRSWVKAAILPEPPVLTQRPPQPEPVAPRPAPASGVSILPEGGAVRVVLHGPAAGLRVTTRLQPGGRAEVAATGAASDARFRTGPGRIEVRDAGPGDLLVVLPSEATAAMVEVNGRTVIAKQGEQLRTMRGAISTTPAEAEFEVGP